jgi:uncharacterized protein (DUF885 family)
LTDFTPAPASEVFELADRYVEESAALDPIGATSRGIPGHETELTDFSPEGYAARVELARSYLEALGQLAPEPETVGHADRLAFGVMTERLAVDVDTYDAGEWRRSLRILGSPVQSIRSVFDLMPTATEADWADVAARLEKVPTALAGYIDTLRDGAARGEVSPRRQALECAKQADTWSGDSPFFLNLVEKAPDGPLSDRLDRAAGAATEAYAGLASYLRDVYAPAASEVDAVGADRYQLAARAWLGTGIDAVDTYRWGWDELGRIEAEMAAVAEKIVPGGTVEDAKALLESDPDRAIEGEENLRAWIQDLMDSTIAELDGRHFDIPEPVKTVQAMIAPPGGAAAMYYTPPSEDFSRPGRTWYPTLGKTRFPLWGEVSIAYHEGVPGHHLQVGQAVYLAGELSRFQRTIYVAGHSEGWALYAERLMDELGYLGNPDYRLGQLRAQAMRAVRVVVDLGMHLQLQIPNGQPFHPGETWTPELAREFAQARAHFPPDFMASEIIRYLGWPAQAISYKVGERVWLETREEVRHRHGPSFDLKEFHQAALSLGPLGLDQMRTELARL